MFPVGHNFHSFVNVFENSIREQHSKTEQQRGLVDLIIFRLKSELFKAEAKGMSFLLPILKEKDKLSLYMIPNIKEVDVGSVDVELKAKDPAVREIEMIAVIYSYCQRGDVCHDPELSQALCSIHTSYEQKIKLLMNEVGIDN